MDPGVQAARILTPAHSRRGGGRRVPGNCIPRIRFVVQVSASFTTAVDHASSRLKQQVVQPTQALQNALEGQILRIFRGAALASVDERAYKDERHIRAQSRLFILPSKSFVFLAAPLAVASRGQHDSGAEDQQTYLDDTDPLETLLLLYGVGSRETTLSCIAAKPTFDNVGALTSVLIHETAAADALTLAGWTVAARRIHSCLYDTQSPDFEAVLAEKAHPVSLFSRRLCVSALPEAVEVYRSLVQQGPYRSNEHREALASAIDVFRSMACGALFDTFRERLVTNCTNYWLAGRQLCEVVPTHLLST